jgi:hypothetical protein
MKRTAYTHRKPREMGVFGHDIYVFLSLQWILATVSPPWPWGLAERALRIHLVDSLSLCLLVFTVSVHQCISVSSVSKVFIKLCLVCLIR